MKRLLKMINRLQSHLFKRRLNRKIKEANYLHGLTGARYLVISDGKKIVVYKRALLKMFIAQNRIPNINTIQQLEKKALYITK